MLRHSARRAAGSGDLMNHGPLCEELVDVVLICLKSNLKLWLEIKFFKQTVEQGKKRPHDVIKIFLEGLLDNWDRLISRVRKQVGKQHEHLKTYKSTFL